MIIAMLTGDCVPLIIWHHPTKLHGILHIGLLGLVNNIITNLMKVYSKYSIDSSEVNYFLGPAITKKNYNLSFSGLWSAIGDQVITKNAVIQNYISVKKQGMYMDLQLGIEKQLINIGSDLSHIQYYPDCVAEPNSPFFSHYAARHRGLENGRFMSVISVMNQK